MKYTRYHHRIDIITKQFRDTVVKRLYSSKLRKMVRAMGRAEKLEYLRVNALANEFRFRMEMCLEEGLSEELQTSRLSDTLISLAQIAQEDAWAKDTREIWFPETRHLVDVLTRVDINAHPDELYHGELFSKIINLPDGFVTGGWDQPLRSVLVTIGTVNQMIQTWDDLVDRYVLPESLKGTRWIRYQGDQVRIYIATCDGPDFFVSDFPLEHMGELLRGNVKDDHLTCVTPITHDPFIPIFEELSEPFTRSMCVAHYNIALRVLIYAQAFPEVVVDFRDQDPHKNGRRHRRVVLREHPRVKQDSSTVRYITHRKGYPKRAHTKVLRAARFKRNPDGSPRVVPVKECWVPPIGYIGSQKKTVKELEDEAIKAQRCSA